MDKSNDDILKGFLLTASEEDCRRAIRFELDAISSFDGYLPIHLTHNGATKEILTDPKQFEDLNSAGMRNLALELFRKELKVNDWF